MVRTKCRFSCEMLEHNVSNDLTIVKETIHCNAMLLHVSPAIVRVLYMESTMRDRALNRGEQTIGCAQRLDFRALGIKMNQLV